MDVIISMPMLEGVQEQRREQKLYMGSPWDCI